MTDINVAIRALRKNSGFSIVALLTIAVGIGANTALFSVYDRLVLRPVTIPDSRLAGRGVDAESAAQFQCAGGLLAAL